MTKGQIEGEEENFTTISGCSQFEFSIVADTITVSREKLKRLVEIANQAAVYMANDHYAQAGGDCMSDTDCNRWAQMMSDCKFIQQFKKEIGE